MTCLATEDFFLLYLNCYTYMRNALIWTLKEQKWVVFHITKTVFKVA